MPVPPTALIKVYGVKVFDNPAPTIHDGMGSFTALEIWSSPAIRDHLSWYYEVSNNLKPAKYLICRRVPVNGDIRSAGEDELWELHSKSSQEFNRIFNGIREGSLALDELQPAKPSLLDLKVALTKRMLSHCNFCRWNCGVDRTVAAKYGTCQLGSESKVSSYFHHRGEELTIRGTKGSGTIFFTSCNQRCVFCVHPETVILTDRGLYTIEEIFEAAENEIQYGDGFVRFPKNLYTYSYDGRKVRIVKVFKHYYSGDLIEIKPSYAPPIMVTSSHQMVVYDPGGGLIKIPAKDLSPRHKLLIPFPRVENPSIATVDVEKILSPIAESIQYTVSVDPELQLQTLVLAEKHYTSKRIEEILGYHPAYVHNLVKRRSTVIMENGLVRFNTEKHHAIPSRIPINADFAELLGYYCAEGHVTKSKSRPGIYRVVLSFGRHEEQLINRVFELFRKVFGVEPRVVERETTTTLEVGEGSLAILLSELCGSNAKNKHVPNFLFYSEPKVIESFLKAFVAGNGCVTRGYISVNTVSRMLALGLYALYLIIGHLPTFFAHTPPREKNLQGRRVEQSLLYFVKVNQARATAKMWNKAKHVKYKIADGYAVVPIHTVDRVGYSGAVYNLEVEDTSHTYMANCLAVGNCQNSDISHDKNNGVVFTPHMLAWAMWQLRMEGCHNINLVGGEPTIHLHTIVEAISLLRFFKGVEAGALEVKADLYLPYRMDPRNALYKGEFNTPILWNSNMFMSGETMAILRELVDIWLPDFKFGNDKCAVRLARTPWYFETVSKNHRLIYEWGEDIVIRHLIMPGHVECCTKPVLKWIAENMPSTPVNIMDQYHPDCYCNPSDPRFDRRYADMARYPSREEILESYRYAKELGLNFEEITFDRSVYGLSF